MLQRANEIALNSTNRRQTTGLAKAAGAGRFTYNWVLRELIAIKREWFL